MSTFPDVDTRDATAVASRIREHLLGIDPQGDLTLIDQVYEDVELMFRGQLRDFKPIDLSYHDYQHTLQATLCMAELLAGRSRAEATPEFSWRQIELGMTAVLFHDSGYLMTAGDGGGTGAKFTYTHVARSVAVAASHLPRYGVGMSELDIVLNAIRCTGPESEVNQLPFRNESDLLIGCCVATADFLGQMAATDYPDELEILFREFEESDDYVGIPRDQRIFQSSNDLISKTPDFWLNVVIPKLETDFRGVHHQLAEPYPDGANAYVLAIERNMEKIRQRIATLAP